MTDDQWWNRWNLWMETILEEVQTALINRRIFREVRAMIDANPRIQKASSFYEWMAGVYGDSALMAVRRQLDNRADSVSLHRLLADIQRNPHVLSRARFVAFYPSDMRDAAELEFDHYVGAGAQQIDPAVVQNDLDSMRKQTLAVERYATKRVAHADAVGPTNIPTMGEVEEAVGLLGALLRRYRMLVQGLPYNEPEWAYDWKAVFREPWIPPER